MPKTRIGGLGLIVGAAALVAVACGGGDDDMAVTAPQSTAVPPAATAAPAAPPAASSETAAAPTSGPARFTWEVSEVDSAGAKPSIAVDASGTPHIAFMSEDFPGFVKAAVPNGAGWDISTVATGYF